MNNCETLGKETKQQSGFCPSLFGSLRGLGNQQEGTEVLWGPWDRDDHNPGVASHWGGAGACSPLPTWHHLPPLLPCTQNALSLALPSSGNHSQLPFILHFLTHPTVTNNKITQINFLMFVLVTFASICWGHHVWCVCNRRC